MKLPLLTTGSLNHSHALARGMIAFWPTRQPYYRGSWTQDVAGRSHLQRLSSSDGTYPVFANRQTVSQHGPARASWLMHRQADNDGASFHVSHFPWPSHNISMAVWVNPVHLSVTQSIMGEVGDGVWSDGTYLYMDWPGRLGMQIGTDVYQSSTSIISSWHWVAGCYDGTTVALYVDGVSVSTWSRSASIDLPSLLSFRVGYNWWNADAFSGWMADPIVYNRGLNAAENWALYHEARTGFSGLLPTSLPYLEFIGSAPEVLPAVPSRHRVWSIPEVSVWVVPKRRHVATGEAAPPVTAPPVWRHRRARGIDLEEVSSCPSRHGTIAAVYAGSVETIEQSVLFDEVPIAAGGPLLASRYRR